MALKIGVDVGGTNTDAVIVDHKCRVLGAEKVPTTKNVGESIYRALDRVLSSSGVNPQEIKYLMMGTTQCRNAILESRHLAKIGVLRLGAPAGLAVEPLYTWPEELKNAVGNNWAIVNGGVEYDGTLISPVNPEEISEVLNDFKRKGIEALAVSSIFSPVSYEQEIRVKQLAQKIFGPAFPITLSHEVGSIGLLERENSAALNAAISKVAAEAANGLEEALRLRGIEAKTFFSQNDGTLMSLEYAKKFPVLTICSGPSNSLRGAAFLSGLTNCIVVDVGGTSTDIGVMINGFPRESADPVELGEVKTNFRMPDLISLAIGGGSVVEEVDGVLKIGPRSLGYKLTTDGLAWGGATFTVTDAFLACRQDNVGYPGADLSNLRNVDTKFGEKVLHKILLDVEMAVEKIKIRPGPIPIVVVGGGSLLLPNKIGDVEVIRPRYYQYANALGAAIAQVSAEVDRIWALGDVKREEALEQTQKQALKKAVSAGADPDSVKVVDVEEVPLPYMPQRAVRIKVKAIGYLAEVE